MPKARPNGATARQQASRRYRRPFFHVLVLFLMVSAAFYASFVPNRAPKAVSAVSDPHDGLTFSGAAVLAQAAPKEETLVLAPTQPRTVVASSAAAPQSAVAT